MAATGSSTGRMLSTADAARILGTSEARIRELVRSGLGVAGRRGRRYAFSFQDLVVLRTAHELIERHVPIARVARALCSLVEQLPADRPLSGLRIRAEGSRVVVQQGGLRWNPDTGQTVFDFDYDVDFDAGEIERQAADLRPLAPHDASSPHERALAELERALELEDDDPVAACDAYARAIELDPTLVDAYVNLGRLAHEAGRGAEAIRLYALALRYSPDDPLIHFNLGVAVDDVRGAKAALPHYERALELAPDFADAHYNLGVLCEKLDRPQQALRHYARYRRLTEGG